jgi:hypothetical protein
MPSETQSLLDFIDAVKSQGASDEFVAALLRQNGWSEKRIYQVFSTWYEGRTGKAVPNGGGRIEAAKDAFLYLLAFITLGTWTIQLGSLLFTAIERAFPYAAVDYGSAAYAATAMASDLASIIVGFPLFLLVTWVILRGVRQQPERLESPVRKWLTYIALVVTASTMIGDLVTFLAYLLRGDLDTRFVLKVVTVMAIAGWVFLYFLDSLRRERVSWGRNRLFAIAALGMVALGLVVGFVQIGSPAVQRSASEDARRLFDLSSLAQNLHVAWQARRADFTLPATIEDARTLGSGGAIVDPASGRPYGYTPLQGTSYRLCATFSRSISADLAGKWGHPAGVACFTLDARDSVVTTPRVFR